MVIGESDWRGGLQDGDYVHFANRSCKVAECDGGYSVRAMDSESARQAVQDAYAEYDAEVSTAWSRSAVTQWIGEDNSYAPRPTHDSREAAYRAYDEELANAWRVK